MGVAKEYYACGQYTECRREVELLLHDYPWCDEALSLLRRLYIREHQYVDEERRTTRDGMIRDVTGKSASRYPTAPTPPRATPRTSPSRRRSVRR